MKNTCTSKFSGTPSINGLLARIFGLLYLIVFIFPAHAVPWIEIYDSPTLKYWKKEFPVGIQENFHQVIIPALNKDQHRVLIDAQISYPESGEHPLSFTYQVSGKKINLPISSLRFLGDLCIAYVWLNHKKMSLDPITNYLLMLKYQGVRGFSDQNRQPLSALGIPDDAKNDLQLQRQSQHLFSTAVIFLLAHELGHIYHQHQAGKIESTMSQRQEMEADMFAMELMKKIGAVPVGVIPFFIAYAHLDPLHGDADFNVRRSQATHPTSPERLQALAMHLKSSAHAFGGTTRNMQVAVYTADQVRAIADILAQPGVQGLMRMKGLTSRPEMLRMATGNKNKFSLAEESEKIRAINYEGQWRGQWTQTRGAVVDLPVVMILRQSGMQVQGYYDFGAGTVSVNGIVDQDGLHYEWKWGSDYFGRGILKLTGSRQMTGSWGYTRAESGGGIWMLQQE